MSDNLNCFESIELTPSSLSDYFSCLNHFEPIDFTNDQLLNKIKTFKKKVVFILLLLTYMNGVKYEQIKDIRR